jgi:hypothetical protein
MKLTRLEDRWARATLSAMFPGAREDGFDDIVAMDLSGYLAETTGDMPLRAALGVRVAIWVVALAPLLVVRRLVTIAGLAADERERVVATLAASRSYAIRSFVMILKTIGCMLYAGNDAIRARLHRAPILSGPALVHIRRIKPAHVA